eukprot:IDg6069t1
MAAFRTLSTYSQTKNFKKGINRAPSSRSSFAIFRALSATARTGGRYSGPAKPAAVDGVFSCDDIAQPLINRLKVGADKTRKTSPHDVHPGSDGLVIDLIHPSMYAYEQGVTPVLGGANVYNMPEWQSFMTTKEGKPKRLLEKWTSRCAAKKGLHGYLQKMYAAIGDAFLQALPLLEEMCTELGSLEDPYERPLRVPDDDALREEEDPSFVADSEDYE